MLLTNLLKFGCANKWLAEAVIVRKFCTQYCRFCGGHETFRHGIAMIQSSLSRMTKEPSFRPAHTGRFLQAVTSAESMRWSPQIALRHLLLCRNTSASIEDPW